MAQKVVSKVNHPLQKNILHTFRSHNQWPDQVGHEFPSLEDNMGNNIPDISEDAQDGSLRVDNYQLLGCQMVAKDHNIVGCKSQCLLGKNTMTIVSRLYKIIWIIEDWITLFIKVNMFILSKKRNATNLLEQKIFVDQVCCTHDICFASHSLWKLRGKEWKIMIHLKYCKKTNMWTVIRGSRLPYLENTFVSPKSRKTASRERENGSNHVSPKLTKQFLK